MHHHPILMASSPHQGPKYEVGWCQTQSRRRHHPTWMDLNVRHAIAPAHSAVPPFAFFVGSFKFSVEAACKMAVCINVMGKHWVWCRAGSLVDLSLFFSDLMASSFSRPLSVVPCMQWHAAIPITIKAITSAKGGPGPLQGGTHASHIALCGLGPHAFFLVETCFCTVYNFNICYFSPLNTQVRVLLSESAHAYVVALPIFPFSITWQLCQPFVTWFLLSLSDHFSPIGDRN